MSKLKYEKPAYTHVLLEGNTTGSDCALEATYSIDFCPVEVVGVGAVFSNNNDACEIVGADYNDLVCYAAPSPNNKIFGS